MKVTNNLQRTSSALHSNKLSGEYKNQGKQIWTFLDVFTCGKKSMFSAR